ncbi:MAG: exodeoxyribonuclease VII large subunit [Deltaproteobacteria bacterium]|jgi:exodeoxyribonuclease VII large subunit|nr:exodeoxyribonuclease VII large subunit [Deltaproteobacteria bacterium]
MNSVYSVSELTAILRQRIEGAFPFVWVRGQLSNLSRPASGHVYFSLRDEESVLAGVWFRGQQRDRESFDPFTGEVYADGPRPGLAARLENGMEIVCAGRLSLYAPRGVYQLVAEFVQESGKGRRQLEFELLKLELAQKGYFDPLSKRALPLHPRRVALITSPAGAAVHDFLRIARNRGLPAQIRIHPSLVQGEGAAAEMVRAFAAAREQGWAEVIVLLRGGGSLEDLWAFNSREVVEAVRNSPVPVLCGVGHEVDVTLADLAADLRASTPSHAAQLLFKERRELAQAVDELELSLRGSLAGILRFLEQRLILLEKSLALLSPLGRLERAGLLLRAESGRLDSLMRAFLLQEEGRLKQEALRLSGLDPLLPLERGYALARGADGSLLRSRSGAVPGDKLDILFRDGALPVLVRS